MSIRKIVRALRPPRPITIQIAGHKHTAATPSPTPQESILTAVGVDPETHSSGTTREMATPRQNQSCLHDQRRELLGRGLDLLLDRDHLGEVPQREELAGLADLAPAAAPTPRRPGSEAL